MSMSPEQKIYATLKTAIEKSHAKGTFRLQRIETSTATGVPDVYFRHKNFACWLETKTMSYEVSKEQYAWASIEKMAGGRCWVVTTNKLGQLLFLDFDSRMVGVSLKKYMEENSFLTLSFPGWATLYLTGE